MKNLGRSCGPFVGLTLLLSSPVWVWAQSQTTDPDANKAAEISRQVEALEKKIDELQSELQQLKDRKNEAGTAPAPSVAKADPAAGTPGAAPAAGSADPAAPASATAPSTLASLLGATTFSGFVDGYYGYNFQHPHLSSAGGAVPLGTSGGELTSYRAFDAPTEALTLNLIELIADKPPDPTNSRLGYHVSLGFGNAMNVVNATDPGGVGFAQYLKEAYLSYLASVGKGLQVDFGKFVTQHGAEVIESKDNWNYSRGLLFTYAIPFYHFGLRSKYVFNDKYNFSAYLVNGWNNIVDNNTGKTVGLQFGWNPAKKWGVVQNYMVGPEEANNNRNLRQLWDTVVTYAATPKLSLMANYDYARGDRMPSLPGVVFWTGGAGYIRYAFNDKYALATRYEYFDDPSGFTTGTGQHLNEYTATLERVVAHRLITRMEFRRDLSNRPSFLRGSSPVDAQNTVEAGLIYTFDSKESH